MSFIRYGQHYSLDEKQPLEWPELFEFIKERHRVWIPVTQASFGDVGQQYEWAVKQIINYGYIYTIAFVKNNHIEFLYCIEEGDCGDEDGYGREGDTWLVAKMDFDGNFVVPFYLSHDR